MLMPTLQFAPVMNLQKCWLPASSRIMQSEGELDDVGDPRWSRRGAVDT
jgi:hypothetical protein